MLRVFTAKCKEAVELSGDVIVDRELEVYRGFQSMVEQRCVYSTAPWLA